VEATPAQPSLLKMVTTTNIPPSSSHSAAAVRQMKEELLKKVELLSSHLPANTLDQLIDELGGPECVAEVSGGNFATVNYVSVCSVYCVSSTLC